MKKCDVYKQTLAKAAMVAWFTHVLKLPNMECYWFYVVFFGEWSVN